MSSKSASSRTSSHDEATLEELKTLLADAEKALSAAGDQASEEIIALRARLREALTVGKIKARLAYEYAKEQAARADEAIHTHPYVAIGIAAGVGVLAGALLGRNCRSS
jgi:ElaB/YqjD/DUF883 family membrane-anchored ribosome-binding protein